MKNNLTDLNDHLFEQLERLNDEDLEGDRLAVEIERGRAITGVAAQIIANGTLVLKAQQFVMDSNGRAKVALPKFLDGENEKEI